MMFRKFIAVLFETWHTKTDQDEPTLSVPARRGPMTSRRVKIREFQAQAQARTGRAAPSRAARPVQGSIRFLGPLN